MYVMRLGQNLGPASVLLRHSVGVGVKSLTTERELWT